MINHTYRLIAPKVFRTDFIEQQIHEDDVVVRPSYLSICAADQRYYTGRRAEETLREKLPMALIHEAVGTVVYDPMDKIAIGTKVVLIPNCPVEKNPVIKENYLSSSRFMSSSTDGFMQDLVVIRRDRVIALGNLEPSVAVLTELMSVGMNAVSNFENNAHENRECIGVWGDGNVGFVIALLLRKLYPQSRIVLLGTNREKQRYFAFLRDKYRIDEIPAGFSVDHAFECVGGAGAENAINQIIDVIKPQGTISLLGVSEERVAINTRMVLEKGLTLLGNSRSGYEDFMAAVKLMQDNEDVIDYLSTIISDEVEVKTVEDMYFAFDADVANTFKTVMKWSI